MEPEVAKRLTDAITELRESPTPIKADELATRLARAEPDVAEAGSE